MVSPGRKLQVHPMFKRWRTSRVCRVLGFQINLLIIEKIWSWAKWLAAWEDDDLTYSKFKMSKILSFILWEQNIRIPNAIFLLKFVDIDIFCQCLLVAKCSWGMTELRSLSGWSAQLVLLPNYSMGGSRCLVARGPLVPNFSQFKLETKISSLPLSVSPEVIGHSFVSK